MNDPRPRHETFLALAPAADTRKDDATHLGVSVCHRGYPHYVIAVTVDPETHEAAGAGARLIHITSGASSAIEPAKRYNAKRVAAVFEEVKADLEARRGAAWELVERVLAKRGRELAA